MNAIIGGSPSTGSSLLRQMLNRHSEIYCGPETRLFTRPELFINWSTHKKDLVKDRGFVKDIYLQKGFNLIGEEQGVDRALLVDLVEKASSFEEFVDSYFSIPKAKYGKSQWMEKTPANVFTFDTIATNLAGVALIHIVRHPYDVVTSLTARGHSLFESVGRWLLSTAHALKASDSPVYRLVRYEDLVAAPNITLGKLMGQLNMEFEPNMIGQGNPHMTEPDKMKGWKSQETSLPNESSIGRYRELDENQLNGMVQAFGAITLSSAYTDAQELSFTSPAQVSVAIGYTIESATPTKKMITQLKTDSRNSALRSAARGHTFPVKTRPLSIGQGNV